MILYGGLVALFQAGSRHAASSIGMNFEEFSSIITGMFFLIVIASEFLVNYKYVFEGKAAIVVDKIKYYVTLPFNKIGELFKKMFNKKTMEVSKEDDKQ